MAGMQHAFDYLQDTKSDPPSGVWVLVGDEPFLKRLVRKRFEQRLFGDDDADASVTTFAGDSAAWRDVSDELRTVSLFASSGKRLVWIEGADPFVSKNRQSLEELAGRTNLPGVLLLDVHSWPGNTRLAKLINQSQRSVACQAPVQARGRSKSFDAGRTCEWLVDWGANQHNVKLQKKAAQALLSLVGPEFGLLDQELAKLALFVKPGGAVNADLVNEVVGGWSLRTTWDMLDAALEGRTAEAMRQLDRLLTAGQAAQALFGQISWSLRRFAAATRVFQRSQRQGRRISLSAALEKAGVQHWQVQGVEAQLRRIGSQRAGQFYGWLLETDLALKGSHSVEGRARWALERLLLRLAGPPANRGAATK